MMGYLKMALNWSEVWALLIPLTVLVIRWEQPAYQKPVIAYLFIALMLDLVIDISWLFPANTPTWLKSNNPVYNLHSIVRFVCFSSFFLSLPQPVSKGWKRGLAIGTAAIVAINFIFFEDFFRHDYFSSRLFAIEAAVLLFYCLQYYWYKFHEEKVSPGWPGDFWVTTGLSIYVVFNFPYFLLYTTLVRTQTHFAELMWNFHNVSFIILCIFIARGLYVSGHR